MSNDPSSPQQPRKKHKPNTPTTLEIILGCPKQFDALPPSILAHLTTTYSLQPHELSVPGRAAQSKNELATWNASWPTVYFHRNSDEFRTTELLSLTPDDIHRMTSGMTAAVADARRSGGREGVAIVCPRTKEVVSVATDERREQLMGSCVEVNPLASAVVLAIQGVSRRERAEAIKEREGVCGEVSKTGQYLCTGYDVYLTKEPGVYDAMALLHSRVRRVVYGVPDERSGGLGSQMSVHCLPGTNHRYRAFKCCVDGESNRQCRDLYEE